MLIKIRKYLSFISYGKIKLRLRTSVTILAAITVLMSNIGVFAAAGLPQIAAVPPAQPPVQSSVSGEIERLTLDDPNDPWSGGTMVIGGQVVIIPRNMLLDLPANRLTLNELFAQAPAACQNGANGTGESGLAKADTCNLTGAGGFASIAANRSTFGNAIAGDVFIEKGIEAVTGVVTYINYSDGYFRLNGDGDAFTGVMVRLNDPDGRHTVQQGAGCGGGPNCSPDPRFTLDADNYTNVFTTGYPLCIPSTVSRTFDDVLGLGTTTAQAAANGNGDVLCPLTNRTASGLVPNSHLLAPIILGDSITAEGNFETINGVRFLSAHSSAVSDALETSPGQPDYLFLDEVEMDAGGFQNERARTLIIGYATLAVPTIDVVLWSIHYDPIHNEPHEFPLASVVGCDNAAGAGTCGAQGLVGAGANIFKIRHDVDFLAGAKPRLNPCAHLQADPRFAGLNICPNGGAGEDASPATIADQFAILSPMPHEIQARTGNSLDNPGLITLDVNGNEATNGQYLFPFGVGLGGVAFPEFNEINLDAIATPNIFTALPWTLDRRLSPAGCIDTSDPADGIADCEATAQPLSPYPFEDLDPRTQASAMPTVVYFDPNYTFSPLSNASNRIFSYINPLLTRPLGSNGGGTNATGNFDGNATLLAWPPENPPMIPIDVTPPLDLGVPVSPLPAITSFTSNSGPVGTSVTITGTGFTGATSFKFNGTPALFLADSDTTIIAVVPAGAATGKLTVTTAGGTGTSADTFTVTVPVPAPTITNFTPASGPVGTSVTISGANFSGATEVSFNGTAATFTVDSDTSISTSLPAGATTGTISVTTAEGTATSADTFTVTALPVPAPTITSFSPDNGPVGTNVTISGANFSGATDVSFNGTAATFTVDSDTSISASVPAGATTGTISVTTAEGTGTSVDTFTVTVPVPAPAITSFTPTSGPVGTSVTISGANFSGAIDVSFNGAAATFTVDSDTSISASVPAGATTGTISVTTAGGTATSADPFTVTVPVPAPAITSFTPASGPVGTSVTISGANFSGATNVNFNGTAATFTVNSDTSISASVPAGATTGTISVTTVGGTATSPANFTVTVTDSLTVTIAEYRTGKGQWRIDGTSSIIGPSTITIYLGTGFTGPIIGTAQVNNLGVWRFRPANNTVAGPGAIRTISIRSSNGGELIGITLTVRN